jgi:hypothetical protein
MLKTGWQGNAALMLVCLGFELHSASAQSGNTEPFTAISKDKLADATPVQSQRLKQIERLRTTESVHVFRETPNATIGDQLKISIPDDKTIVLLRTGGEKQDSKDFTWLGEVQGDERSTATLVSRNGEITGTINGTLGLYRITPLGNQIYAIVKVNAQRLPPEEPPARAEKNE